MPEKRIAMIDKINYDQRYDSLLEVCRYKSVTLASRELGLTYSAVLQQIRSLERELGIELFRRDGKQCVPTEECKLIVDYIKKIQSMCRRMTDDIESLGKRSDRLIIGITPSVEDFALAGMVEKLTDPRFPMQITVIAGTSKKLCEMLESYAIDLAVIEGGLDGEKFNELILDTDHLSVAVPSGSRYAKKRMIEPEELLGEPLIMKPKDSGTRRLLEASLSSAGILPERLKVIMEVDNTNTIIKLVSSGYGLSVLSSKACAKDVREGKIATVPLCGIGMSRSIRVVYRSDHELGNILGELRRVYAEVISELGQESI